MDAGADERRRRTCRLANWPPQLFGLPAGAVDVGRRFSGMFARGDGAWLVVIRYGRMVIKCGPLVSLARCSRYKEGPCGKLGEHMSSRDTRLPTCFHHASKFLLIFSSTERLLFRLVADGPRRLPRQVLHLLPAPQLLFPTADKAVHAQPSCPAPLITYGVALLIPEFSTNSSRHDLFLHCLTLMCRNLIENKLRCHASAMPNRHGICNALLLCSILSAINEAASACSRSCNIVHLPVMLQSCAFIYTLSTTCHKYLLRFTCSSPPRVA